MDGEKPASFGAGSVCACQSLRLNRGLTRSCKNRLFEKNGLQAFQSFAELVYQQFGLRVLIFGGYPKGDEEVGVMMCVYVSIRLRL
jgi:hypothetical protein